MKYFKYLLFVITALLSIDSYASCQSGINKDLDVSSSIINSSQTHVCNNSCRYKLNACVDVDIELSSGICTATSTGEACTGSNPDPVENDPILQCSTDSCPNPENKRCPTGYTRGSFNGQNICAKSKTPPDPEPCEGENCESDQDVINAVNDANYSITGAISDLNNSLFGILVKIKNVLYDISDTIADSANGGDGDGNGDGDGYGDGYGEVDTSDLYAETPIYDTDEHYLNENLFSSIDECPPENVLNLNFMGSSFSYTFSYDEICNSLYSLSFIVMILAYMVAIYIVSRE